MIINEYSILSNYNVIVISIFYWGSNYNVTVITLSNCNQLVIHYLIVYVLNISAFFAGQ